MAFDNMIANPTFSVYTYIWVANAIILSYSMTYDPGVIIEDD